MGNKFKYVVNLLIISLITLYLGKGVVSTPNSLIKIFLLAFITCLMIILIKNILLMLDKYDLAQKINKLYIYIYFAFIFIFIGYWCYVNFKKGNYFAIIFALPFIYFSWLIWKKKKSQ